MLTGEGSFDFQSVRGKVAGGVAKAATAHGVPCLVLAGQVSLGRQQAAAAGVEAAYSVAEQAGSVEAAMARPGDDAGRARRARGRGVEPQVGRV